MGCRSGAADFHLCCRPRANDAPCQIKACKSQEDSARADPFHPRPRHTLVFSSRLSQLKWLALHFSLPLCNPTDVTSTLCTRAREKTIAERRRYRRHGERWLEPPNRDVVACRSQESTTLAHVCYEWKMPISLSFSINLIISSREERSNGSFAREQ